MNRIDLPKYSHHFQPSPIQDILQWVDGFLEDWYYWNQSYVNYYMPLLNKSRIDRNVLLDNQQKEKFEGMQYYRFKNFPLIVYGNEFNLQYEGQSEKGIDTVRTINIQVIDKIYQPQIGDIFELEGIVFQIISLTYDLYRRVYKSTQKQVVTVEEFKKQQNIYDTNIDYEDIPFNIHYKIYLTFDMFINNVEYSTNDNVVDNQSHDYEFEVPDQISNNDNLYKTLFLDQNDNKGDVYQ